jgi:uncharacterized protein
MLIEFRVRNFKSFKEEQVLSMVASSDKSLLENTSEIPDVGMRLLRSAVIYGANASGKSNLMKALLTIRRLVTQSVEIEPGASIPVTPFLLDKDFAEAPSSFEISFIHEGIRYEYGFSVDSEQVHEEWLNAYPKGRSQTWFERSTSSSGEPDEWYFGPNLKGEKKTIAQMVRSNALFLSVAAKFAHEQLTPVYNWFSNNLQGINFSSGYQRKAIEAFTIDNIESSSKIHSRVVKLLRAADLGISDVLVNKRPFSDAEAPMEMFSPEFRAKLMESEAVEVEVFHSAQGGDISFEWDDESCGTRRLFAMSGPWLFSLDQGLVLVVDEIDSSLHPALVRKLIQMFHDSELNTDHGQLIFNTHDTTQLDGTLFRRDQIWLVEKDKSGASHLYPLLEFKPRKQEALEKGYLQGRYGAIPFTGSFKELNE